MSEGEVAASHSEITDGDPLSINRVAVYSRSDILNSIQDPFVLPLSDVLESRFRALAGDEDVIVVEADPESSSG